MENLGVVIGIAVAVAIAIFLLRDRQAPRAQRTRAALIGLVAAAFVAAIGVYAVSVLRGGTEDPTTVDRAMASARAMPLVGPVLDDVPGAEDRLRTALKEEIRQPTTQGASRPVKLMRELRVAYVVPALKAADEASAAEAIGARTALLRHLHGTDLVVCKEFALTGIQRSDRLDATAQKLLHDVLAALEKAYRSGRAARKADAPPPPVASVGQARELLGEAGYEQDDLDKLAHLASLTNEEACDIALKFNEAPSKLPPAKRGALMRYLLTVQ